MKTIEASTYRVEIEWDQAGQPVLYVTCHGSVNNPQDAIKAIEAAVQTIDEEPFEHVCVAYNLLAVGHVPFLGRFLKSRRMATPRTAHIVVATTIPSLRLMASLLAVSGGNRLRTLAVCLTQEELEAAVRSWLSIPDSTRAHNVNKNK